VTEDFDDTIVRPPSTSFSTYPIDEPDSEDTVIVGGVLAQPLTDAVIQAIHTQAPLPPELQGTEPIEFHYRFSVGSYPERFTLDVPWFIGRRPSQPRIVSGTSPRLLRVESPAKEVSATHLGLRQLGPSVIATDLMSTNGSVVLSPGSVPRKLLQGESVVVAPGTLIDIGDGNLITILGTGS
jgi:hypothetical protein